MRIAAALLLCALAAPAQAQSRAPAPRPTGNPIVDIGNAIAGQKQQATASRNADTEDLVGKLGKLALPDFEFALAMSKATNNVVSTPCWQAWVDLLTAQQKPLLGADGQPLTEPDPHLATAVEKISELLAALRPELDALDRLRRARRRRRQGRRHADPGHPRRRRARPVQAADPDRPDPVRQA